MTKTWQKKQLGELLQKTETVNPLQAPDVEFDYIDVSSVSNRTFQIESTQRIKGEEAPSRARKQVRTNDIIFATIRPTLRRIAIVPKCLDKQICSTGYFVLRAKPEIEYRFIFYSLFSEGFMAEMERRQKGASYPAVTDGDIKAYQIQVPPRQEQQRIVKVLDQTFDQLSAAKILYERKLAALDELKKSLLHQAFSGAL